VAINKRATALSAGAVSCLGMPRAVTCSIESSSSAAKLERHHRNKSEGIGEASMRAAHLKLEEMKSGMARNRVASISKAKAVSKYLAAKRKSSS